MSLMPSVRSPWEYNAAAENFVDDVITDPDTIWKVGGRYINAWEGSEDTARGIEWIIRDGVPWFSGFL